MLWGGLSTFTTNPNEQHWKEIDRVSQYLKGTYTYALSYIGYPGVLEGYSDASWITVSHESKSTSGWVFTVSGTAMSRASKKLALHIQQWNIDSWFSLQRVKRQSGLEIYIRGSSMV